MNRITILIIISLLSLQTHAQLILFGKSKLPEGTPYVIAKRIQTEYIPLGIGSIYEGGFEIKIDNIIENEVLFLIFADGRNTEIQFISENERLEYIEKDKFVTGGIENKIRYDFFEKTHKIVTELYTIPFRDFVKYLNENTLSNQNKNVKYKNKRKKKLYNIIKETILENPKSFYSYTLIEKLYKNNELSIDEIITYKTILENNFPYKELTLAFEKEINENKIPLLNSTFPNHKFTDINNVEMYFYEKLDKITLIVFWSTSCNECRKEIENLEKIYKKYNKAGFNIIRINTDAQNDLLKNLIGKNQPKWINLGLKNPKNITLDTIYNIKNTPFSFLIDSTGKIIDKNLDNEELIDKIKEIIK